MGDLLYLILVGAVAGWLAGLIFKGGGFGLLWNIIIGIVGAVVGGFLLGALNISIGSGLIGSIISAVIGALVFLFVASLIKR